MKFLALILMLSLVILFGCDDEGSPVSPNNNNGGNTNISFATSILPILNANCSSCHGSSGGWSVSGLSTAVSNRTLGNFRGASNDLIVSPNNLNQSELYDRITDDNPSRRMPPGGTLTTERRDLVRDWITQGANP